MFARIETLTLNGIDVSPIQVEVDISFGLPSFTIVGLAATSILESRERIRSAIRNSGRSFPTHRITVNLAPAYSRKDGAHFDLAIAVGILMAGEVVRSSPEKRFFCIDLQIRVARLTESAGRRLARPESSKIIQSRVIAARDRQQVRYKNEPFTTNAQIPAHKLASKTQLTYTAQQILEQASHHYKLSTRASHKVIRVARTIADLSHSPKTTESHIAEALQYRF